MLIHQLHQLRSGKALDETDNVEGDTDTPRVWFEEDLWRTDFPPPADFEGREEGDYGDSDYSRVCTPAEVASLDRAFPDACDDDEEALETDEAERDAYFVSLTEPAPADSSGDEAEVASLEPVRPEPFEACPERLPQADSRRGPPFPDLAEQEEQPFDELRVNGEGRMTAQPPHGAHPTVPPLPDGS